MPDEHFHANGDAARASAGPAAVIGATLWLPAGGTFPVSLPVLLACVAVVFAAYLVFGVSGFGASLMTIPALSQLVPLPLLLSIAVVTDLAAACIVAFIAPGRHVPAAQAGASRPVSGILTRADRGELLRLAPGALAGATAGVTLLVGLPREATLLALGVFLCGYGLWAWRSRIPETPLAPVWAAVAGFIGGLCGALFGIGGPPYVIYLTRRILDRDRLRATIGIIVLISLAIRFCVFLYAGLLLQPGLAAMLAVLLPTCAISVICGGHFVKHLSRERLLRIIAVLLAASGAMLVVRALAALHA